MTQEYHYIVGPNDTTASTMTTFSGVGSYTTNTNVTTRIGYVTSTTTADLTDSMGLYFGNITCTFVPNGSQSTEP
jgi:hypothetical protein